MVNPGFAGQHMVLSTLRKAAKVQSLLEREHHEDILMEVDGNITPEHGKTLRSLGASLFVGGTSSIFKGDLNQYRENIRLFRESIV